ncbi:BZ3500_MvSof-1268-A1-R1_Chr8-2g10253 [Microbotryum saponariae]|uniref:BZ3500_MvSof-1268-A1-R1_Chr8-2g10253 protein n=1 Tax=Microbotryum saponariae TaxID=289078 RepID=A0A2X0L5S9_9BASI|nr:BZ3500_MvSof-1268-A1-R1_Chr8-2g10253 [Microbotryum saponariae]SDA02051.1 BZ3501_MvSof-1269-A2-R1_Chr8-2g10003 [Microbotryum saponariae]
MRSKIGDFAGFYLRASGWAFMGPDFHSHPGTWNRTGSVAAAISSPPASTIKPRQRDRFQSRHSRQCNATPSRADKRRINELPNDGQDSAPSAIDQLGKNPLGIRTCTETSSGSKATRGGGDGGGGDPFDGDEDDGVASAQSEGRWEHPKWLTELYNSKREMIKAANGSGANRSTNCCMVGFRPKLCVWARFYDTRRSRNKIQIFDPSFFIEIRCF